MFSTWNGRWRSENNNWKRNCFFSTMIPYLLQLVMAQNRSDIVLFLFFWGVVLLYINFPSSKNPAPSSSWGLSLTWRGGKTSGSLSWFLESLFQKNKATLVSFKKTLTHKDIVEIVSQVVTSKNKTGETIFSINIFFHG